MLCSVWCWFLSDYPFLSQTAKPKRRHVYGLGSDQYREHMPSACVSNGLAENLELEMRVGGLERSLHSVTAYVSVVNHEMEEMKQEMSETRASINQLLQTLLPQQEATGQPQVSSSQLQHPSSQSKPNNGIQK